jgi:lysophospholipase L1-like esterase
VRVVVFYDEDDSGALDDLEFGKVPEVRLEAGGASGVSMPGNGLAEIQGVPEGTHTLVATALPPYYQARHQVTVQSPQADGETVFFPVTLDIGGNRPKVFMAFGDSLTLGNNASPGADYPNVLQTRLVNHFASALVYNRGDDGSNSWEGIERSRRNVGGLSPAYSLVMYGTNDWHTPECKLAEMCATPENLREIVQIMQQYDSLTVLATLPPVSPARTDPGRNDWLERVNDALRLVAAEEGVPLADVHEALVDLAGNDPESIFSDHVHLTDAGYAAVAEAFFQAIAYGGSTPAASSLSLPPAAGPLVVPGRRLIRAPRQLLDGPPRADRK